MIYMGQDVVSLSPLSAKICVVDVNGLLHDDIMMILC